MKTAQMIRASLSLCAMAAAGAAYAEPGIQDGADQFPGFTSTKPASEVRNELLLANANSSSGVCKFDGDENNPRDIHSTKTRAEVMDELKDAEAHGLSARSRIDGDELNFPMYGSSGAGTTVSSH